MDIVVLYLFIIGLFFGSFYNVVGLRMSKNESIAFPASHCPNCNHQLSWYELIPVFSWLFLGGKCKKCKKKISIQYPLIELLTGILFGLSYYIFGFTYATLTSIVLCSIAVITFISDFKFMVILDEVLITGGIFLIIINYFNLGLVDTLWRLLYALIMFVIMLIIKLIGDKAFKTESLGWGDVKLSSVAGFILTPYYGLVYIFLGSIIALPFGLINRKKSRLLPFGPFLITALLIIFWNYDFIVEMLSKLFGV